MSDLPVSSGPPEEPTEASITPSDEQVSPADPGPIDVSPSPDEVDKEVANAMASMSDADLAELGGEIGGTVTDVGPSESVKPGTELTGTIMGVSDDVVIIEFGVKSQGMLPRLQFGKKEPLEVGRRVDVVVERYDKAQDLLVVSRKGELQRATWENLSKGMIVEGRVTGMNKGGLEVDINGLRAFMPTSQVDVAMIPDISVLLNERVRAEVIEVDRRGKNVLISRRKCIQREQREAKKTLMAELDVGQTRKGVVGNLTDFGAFVNLGGVEGLVHISDISWGSVDRVSDHLKTGQEIEVQVLKVDKKRGRISLGMKQIQPDPWKDVPTNYPEGTQLKVRVMRLAQFGVFAELEPGVEGLIPISEMSWSRIRDAGEVVSVGDMVDAVLIRVEPERRRLALSMKQAAEDPWAGVLDSYPANALVKGKITRLTAFGAFVELAPAVEGLIHISELSDRHVNSCSEVVQVDQEVETRVLGVDPEARRISLSIKAVAEAPAAEALADASKVEAKPAKKRRKPLRGGLSSHWEWEGGLDLNLGREDKD